MKRILLLVVIFLALIFNKDNIKFTKNNDIIKNNDNDISIKSSTPLETRGVFISYLEYSNHFKDKKEKEIIKEIENIFIELNKYSINTIYLQVRMFSDAIYKSNYFKYTSLISEEIDLLKYFIDYANKYNISLYAWINPFRIGKNKEYISSYVSDLDVLYLDSGIYYDPNSKNVKELIVNSIKELVTNYNIKGIIFDDYFYPKDYNKEVSKIDKYNAINDLIKSVYKVIKTTNKDCLFGISPDANIDNNYNISYLDIKEILSKDNYIDFIIPQIYYGFNSNKPFIESVNEWKLLVKNKAKLIIGLALYKCGSKDNYSKNDPLEWVNNKDIIKRQIEYIRTINNYTGFSLYRLDFLINRDNDNLKKEIENYLKIL